MARWGSVEYLEEEFPQEIGHYTQVTTDAEVSKIIDACVVGVNSKAKNNRLRVHGIVSYNYGEHYVVFLCGGANGNGNWEEYLGAFLDIIKGLNEKGHAWIIKIDNDCCDDVHYALLGFRQST